jgi:hypothetical protein
MPSAELNVLMLMLSHFRVGGLDDEDGKPTQPVRITCTGCKRPSPWLTYRDDGGADYTAPLDDLVKWAQDHRCLRNVGE